MAKTIRRLEWGMKQKWRLHCSALKQIYFHKGAKFKKWIEK